MPKFPTREHLLSDARYFRMMRGIEQLIAELLIAVI